MTRDEYKKYSRMLGEELQKQNVMGEILVADDVVAMLDVKNPEDSDDIDAYFNSHDVIVRKTALHIATREHFSFGWVEELSRNEQGIISNVAI